MQYFDVCLMLDDGYPKYLGTTGARSLGEAAEKILQQKGYDMRHFSRKTRSYYGMPLVHQPQQKRVLDETSTLGN